MVKKRCPDYQLAADHISHYRDMKLVTFVVDRDMHALVVSFPVFVKDYRKPPLAMFEIEMVPVPIPDRNPRANSYTQVSIHKPYIAAGDDYYIQLHMAELVMCKLVCYTYYCEELFVVKHKSKHSCTSTIFYGLGPRLVAHNCHFNYFYNLTVLPVILDGDSKLLLANFHQPYSLKCSSGNGGLLKPAPEHIYAVLDRDFLCNSQLDLKHASILRQLSACTGNKSAHLSLELWLTWVFINNCIIITPL